MDRLMRARPDDYQLILLRKSVSGNIAYRQLLVLAEGGRSVGN